MGYSLIGRAAICNDSIRKSPPDHVPRQSEEPAMPNSTSAEVAKYTPRIPDMTPRRSSTSPKDASVIQGHLLLPVVPQSSARFFRGPLPSRDSVVIANLRQNYPPKSKS